MLTDVPDDALRASLTDTLSLEVRGRPFSQRPFDIRVLLGARGSSLLAKPVRSEFFAPGPCRDGFGRTVADLASRCPSVDVDPTMITDALTTAFDSLTERIGTGSLVVADVQARKIVASTDRVVFTPETGRWTVVFGRSYDPSRYEYDVKKATFGASEWGDHSARGKSLPSSVRRPRAPDPFSDDETGTARWRACRSAWSALAEIGPEPPSVEPIALDSPEDVDRLPQWPDDLSGEEFVALLEKDTPPDVLLHEYGIDRRLVTYVAGALGISDRLD